MLDFHQSVCTERCTGRHKVDDASAQTERGRELHRSVEVDAFRLNTSGGKMASRDRWILCGNANVAPTGWIITGTQFRRFRNREMALADTEIERCIDFGILEFRQDITPSHRQLSATEGDKGRDIETTHPYDGNMRMICSELQLARIGIVERRFRFHARPAHDIDDVAQNSAAWQRNNNGVYRRHDDEASMNLFFVSV